METKALSRRNLLQTLTLAVGGGILSSSNVLAKPIELPAGQPAPKPIFIKPGEGEKGKFGGIDANFKLSKATTGSIDCVEMMLQPGCLAAPPHLHKTFDEISFLQEGTLHVLIGKEVTEITAGSWHVRPRGIVHTFWNAGTTPAKFIEIYTPGGFDGFLKGMSKLFKGNAKPSPQAIAALAGKHDMIIHFEMLQSIMEKYKVHL